MSVLASVGWAVLLVGGTLPWPPRLLAAVDELGDRLLGVTSECEDVDD